MRVTAVAICALSSLSALSSVSAVASCSPGPVASQPPRLATPAPPPRAAVVAPRAAAVPLFAAIAAANRAHKSAQRASLPFLRGSTHVHTLYSGDSRTPPANVVKWYAEAGYDFIVLTDHNRVTDSVSADLDHPSGLLVLRGTELTNNPPSCQPPPPEPKGKCRIHVNALFVSDYPPNRANTRPEPMVWRARNSIARVDLYQAALTKTVALGGLAQLNHPTWHWGTDGKLLTALSARGLRFVEIANVAFAKWNRGARGRAGAEEIWDAALTAGHRLWAVASDDAHHYYDIAKVKASGGALYPPGGGFVMVRAERNAASIREAMARGDFYSSTGILLRRLEISDTDLVIEVEPSERRSVAIEFITTGGTVAGTVRGPRASFTLADASGGYVRARIVATDGSKAWSQPVFVADD